MIACCLATCWSNQSSLLINYSDLDCFYTVYSGFGLFFLYSKFGFVKYSIENSINLVRYYICRNVCCNQTLGLTFPACDYIKDEFYIKACNR
ncbi:hypothetical protein Avbf_13445 [Armadillidium vulgare]|nr:hypothetical protein Avbf_13445 [Armadillidium vulgare]